MEITSQAMDMGSVYAQQSQQDKLIKSATDSVDREKIKEVSQQFESVFMEIVLRSMRDSVNKSELVDGGNAEDIYQGMLDSEYSKMMSSRGKSGLAQDIENQLLRSIGVKQNVSEFSKGLQARKNYEAQALHPAEKQATIKESN